VIPVLFAPQERQKAIALMASATFISFPIGRSSAGTCSTTSGGVRSS